MYDHSILGDIAKETKEIIIKNTTHSQIIERKQLESYISQAVKNLGEGFSRNYLHQGCLGSEDLDEIALRLEKKGCVKAELNPETNSGLVYQVQKR